MLLKIAAVRDICVTMTGLSRVSQIGCVSMMHSLTEVWIETVIVLASTSVRLASRLLVAFFKLLLSFGEG